MASRVWMVLTAAMLAAIAFAGCGKNPAISPSEAGSATSQSSTGSIPVTAARSADSSLDPSAPPTLGSTTASTPAASHDGAASVDQPTASIVKTVNYTEVYPGGKPYRLTTIKEMSDGRRVQDGPYIQWYEDGGVQEKGEYANDRREGTWIQWYQNSQIRRRVHWEHGKLDGQWLEYRADGSLQQQVSYKNGLRDGVWLTFAAGTSPPLEGEPMPRAVGRDEYRRDLLNGASTIWYPTGQKKSEAHYADGKPDGLSTRWYENGQKSEEATYQGGTLAGVVQRWTKDGKPMSDTADLFGAGT